MVLVGYQARPGAAHKAASRRDSMNTARRFIAAVRLIGTNSFVFAS